LRIKEVLLSVDIKYSMREIMCDVNCCAWAWRVRCGQNKCKRCQCSLLHIQFTLANIEFQS